MGGLFVGNRYINYLSTDVSLRQMFCRIRANLPMSSFVQLHFPCAHGVRQKYRRLQIRSQRADIHSKGGIGHQGWSIYDEIP